MTVAVLPVLVGALVGALAGWVIRVLLARLRRGAVLRAGGPELAGAMITGAGVALAWPGPLTLLVVWTGLLTVALGAVDLVHHRLPDALTLPAIPLTAALLLLTEALFPGTGSLLTALAVAAAGTGVFWAVAALAPRGMGLGDVKLVPSLALATGFSSVAASVLAVTIAFLLGAAFSLLGLLTGRLSLTSAIPFGPCLLAGSWLVLAVPGLVTSVVG